MEPKRIPFFIYHVYQRSLAPLFSRGGQGGGGVAIGRLHSAKFVVAR